MPNAYIANIEDYETATCIICGAALLNSPDARGNNFKYACGCELEYHPLSDTYEVKTQCPETVSFAYRAHAAIANIINAYKQNYGLYSSDIETIIDKWGRSNRASSQT